jgi:DNA polymerase-3 subunit epsilon
MPAILDGELACVDLETTGGNAHYNRVIEVGIVLMRDGKVLEEWSSLVNPGTRIPRYIEEFTGISNDMVAAAPDFQAVCDDVLERLSGRLFVAHNARFDYGFLRSEFRRLEVRFRSPVLCTVKLSRRLDPGVRGHGLDAVMERHGLDCSARHRALGDARVLADFLARLRTTRDPAALDAIVADLTREIQLPPQLDPQIAEDLPEGPGVYRFYGEDGALLYVGKSNHLRTRVLSHFASSHRSSKELRLSRQVRHVEWTETVGEFGALLKEARLVKDLAPLHNQRLRKSGEAWVIRLSQEADNLRADIVTLAEADAAALSSKKGTVPISQEKGDSPLFPEQSGPAPASELHGPFRNERDASKALEELMRANSLCARTLGLERGEGSCFGFQVGRCKGACCGKEPLPLHAARVRMALLRHRLRSWPFRGRIAVTEKDWRGLQEMHVFDQWRYLGTVSSSESLAELPGAASMEFDLDSYRILCRYLGRSRPRTSIVELD